MTRRFLEHSGGEQVWKWNPQAGKRDMTLIPHRHRSLTVAMHGDVTIIINGGDTLVSAVILCPSRDVRGVPVRENRRHNQLLLDAGQEGCLPRKHLNLRDQWVRCLWSGHTLRNPTGHDFVFRRGHLKAPSAAVWNGLS